MKKLSKIVSLMLSLALCLGMASPAFAANFTDLQNAIDGKEGKEFAAEDGSTRYGYAENKDDAGNHVSWGIEAWEENGTRNVKLNEDVVRDDNDIIHYNNNRTEERKTVNLGSTDLVLDLNEKKIDGASRDMNNGAGTVYGMMLKDFSSTTTATIKNGTITGSEKDGIFAAGSGTLNLENVNVVGNKGTGVSSRSDFTMTGGSIKDNGGFGLSVGPKGGEGTFAVENTTISSNGFQEKEENNGNNGAGIFVNGNWTGTITDTTIEANAGRGMFVCNSDVTLDGVTIQNNDGGIISEGDLKINNSTIVGNHAPNNADHWSQKTYGGGIALQGNSATLTLGEGNEIHSNTSNGGSAPSDIYVANEGITVNGLDKPSKAPEGQQFDGWYNGEAKYEGSGEFVSDITLVAGLHTHTPGNPVRENEVAAQVGVTGSYDEVVYCSVCGGEISRVTRTTDPLDPPDPPETPDVPSTIIPDPDVPMADGTGTDTATIADQEVPLAGLMPLYMLLEELRQYEEIPEIELPEDFKWLDHEYAQAIYWGLREGLVVDAEDEPFDPDEVVTVALLREVLVNFVEYKGIDLTVTLAGEDDEIVFDLSERLTAFYAELEAALKAQEPKAA